MSPTQLPGFDDSLRLLVVRERYSLTEIGLMFGVSRECVRQWCERRGIVHPDGRHVGARLAYRAWDDRAHRFTPIARADGMRMHRRAKRANRREAATARHEQTRHHIEACVARLRDQLGRDPAWVEIANALGLGTLNSRGYAPAVLNRWDSSSRATRDKLREFRQATGTAPRPRGAAGHVLPKAPRTHCKQGHAFTAENTHFYTRPNGSQGRTCRRCDTERKRRYYAAAKQRRGVHS